MIASFSFTIAMLMADYTILRFWKPFNVLTQFTDPEGRATLADYISVKGVYAAGRLDYDSEGLLILTAARACSS